MDHTRHRHKLDRYKLQKGMLSKDNPKYCGHTNKKLNKVQLCKNLNQLTDLAKSLMFKDLK